ncbi:sigma-54-dependent transcriptional regulator [Desulfurivibrio dismutans]|uniref:sigma-54-dependent transcriptional regulator n=1 Tax=Desulfurivibrio dismutans TaxID=1398908 RepID=UPI0023DAE0B6|nr:sigma 54-interacting transcriptional regulator [Desulfurivibrio alkaliphilus]MDF1615531.1 sigma 54-interacting transcriptional regulator [Desulfurivibrio alkaliphilus]
MARILVVDDDPMICSVLSDFVSSQGHEAVVALRLQEAMGKLEQARPDLVFLDVNLPDGSGLEAIGAIRNHETAPEVIIITGEGSSAGASQAIHNGAWDYVRKPLSVESVELSLNRALQYRRRKNGQNAAKALHRGEIIGKSPALNQCLELAGKAAATDAPVLITGETGTGKELFARLIHENSQRAGHNFVIVDCASLPPTLVESILFGHEKGTFTGANQSRSGLVGPGPSGHPLS